MPLEKPLAYFRKHQEKFAREHHGKFVVIYEEDVEGFYKSELEAYTVAIKKHPDGLFLLRQCLRLEEENVAVFHSRIAG
ncbi:MAG: hypothetical protein F4Z13_06440 [Candidatus Dadabacteria bacterium]|nr:hypothetical protein [Candidatus Dadabacteria bacterium]